MAADYPTTVPVFPSAVDLADDTLATKPHSALHGDEGEEIAAIATTLGITGAFNFYKVGGIDVAVTDGGTGASDATTARANLGLVIGTNVQAWDTDLDDLSTRWNRASSVASAGLNFREDIDNGTNQIRVEAPASISSDRTHTLPDVASGAFVIATAAQTLTNKTIDHTSNTITGTKAQYDTAVTDGNHVWSGDAAGGDLSGTYPNPSVTNDSHTHGISTGGTGQTTQTDAFDALAPTTTTGDTIYHNGTDNVRLAVGAEGDISQVVSGIPAWVTPTPLSALGATAGLDTDDTIIVVEDGLPKQATLANITTLDADDTYLVVEDGQIHQATRDQSTLWAGTRRLLHASTAGDIVVSGSTSLMNGSYDIAANYLAVGDILELEAFGVWLNNTGSNQGMTVNWTIDGVGPSGGQLATGGAITTSASSHSWMLVYRWRIAALGSGLVAVFTVEKTLGAIGATNDTIAQTSQGVLVGTFDTTQVNTIDCVSTQTATNAQLKMTPHACTIWHSRPLDT